MILKSRYGTSDPKAQSLLKGAGCSESALQPFRISKARELAAREFPWVSEHYALLCDFVHPNMSSQRTTVAYPGESSVAHSSGEQLIFAKSAPVVQYQFLMLELGRQAVAQTAVRAVENMTGLVEAMNRMARSPFTEDELNEITGLPYGDYVRASRGYKHDSWRTAERTPSMWKWQKAQEMPRGRAFPLSEQLRYRIVHLYTVWTPLRRRKNQFLETKRVENRRKSTRETL